MLQQALIKSVLGSKQLARSVRLAVPTVHSTVDDDWEKWARAVFSGKFKYSFSTGQKGIWDWMWSLTPDFTPVPRLVILPRGGGKTTTLDVSIAGVLGRKQRNFPLILSANQGKASARVRSIAALLTSDEFRRRYPDVGEPALGERNTLASWNSRLLKMESGQLLAGTSFGSDNRGFNEWSGERPDLIIGDDLDKTFDSPEITKRKIRQFVTEILPTEGSIPAATLLTQNLVKSEGMIDQLREGNTDWLSNRTLIGPIKAIDGFEYEKQIEDIIVDGSTIQKTYFFITRGVATWEGQSLESCQDKINRWGITTFIHEQQHGLTDFEGALLDSSHFRYTGDTFSLSCLKKRVVGVDVAGGKTYCGIVAVARIPLGQFCVLEDASVRTDVTLNDDWADVAVLLAYKWGASIHVETNYGGTLATDPIAQAIKKLKKSGRIKKSPIVTGKHVVGDKRARAFPIAKLHKDGNIVYLCQSKEGVWKLPDGTSEPYMAIREGHFDKIKTEWTTWVQGETTGSPNRVDAQGIAIGNLTGSVKKIDVRGGAGGMNDRAGFLG